MNKGFTTHTYTDSDDKHPLIRVLKIHGYSNIELVYSPTKTQHCGWDLLTSNKGAKWLGHTIEEAHKRILSGAVESLYPVSKNLPIETRGRKTNESKNKEVKKSYPVYLYPKDKDSIAKKHGSLTKAIETLK